MESKDTTNNSKKQLKSDNANNKLRDLKSNFILKILFGYIPKNISLGAIKYNKYIQKRMNININDYKTYSEIYSSIKIELIPKIDGYFNQFINIKNEDEKYYHIYFNNNKKDEIKRYYLNEFDKVSKINIIIDYQVKSFSELFMDCNCIESINFKTFYRNNIINMKSIFCGCSSLKELNFTNFKTDSVIDMSSMFEGCSSLKELNLSNFNTNNVTNMRFMFYYCSALKELNLSNFNTNKVTNMSYMFFKCLSLKEINITNFNTNNVTNMNHMFNGCSDELKLKIQSQYKNFKKKAFD